MKTNLKLSLVAGLLLAAGLAYSQGPMMDSGMHGHGMQGKDPARMQAMMDKRHAALKALLKLTPAQEPAWTAFMDAHKPAGKMGKPEMPDMSKLTTPERVDKMREMHAQRVSEKTSEMEKKGAATKIFYAALTPDQQKLFDAHDMMGSGMKGHDKPMGKHSKMPPAAPAKN